MKKCNIAARGLFDRRRHRKTPVKNRCYKQKKWYAHGGRKRIFFKLKNHLKSVIHAQNCLIGLPGCKRKKRSQTVKNGNLSPKTVRNGNDFMRFLKYSTIAVFTPHYHFLTIFYQNGSQFSNNISLL